MTRIFLHSSWKQRKLLENCKHRLIFLSSYYGSFRGMGVDVLELVCSSSQGKSLLHVFFFSFPITIYLSCTLSHLHPPSPPPTNYHTVVHVHEFFLFLFFLFCSIPLTPSNPPQSLLSFKKC